MALGLTRGVDSESEDSEEEIGSGFFLTGTGALTGLALGLLMTALAEATGLDWAILGSSSSEEEDDEELDDSTFLAGFGLLMVLTAGGGFLRMGLKIDYEEDSESDDSGRGDSDSS